MSNDFKTVVTKGYEDRPNEPGWKVQSGGPNYKKVDGLGLCQNGYSWTLVKEDLYDIYREIDLHFDFKSIKQAKEHLVEIPSKIERLKKDEEFLSDLLWQYDILTK